MDKFAFDFLSETVYVNLQVTRASLLLTQASSVDMTGLSSMIPPPHWHCHHRGPHACRGQSCEWLLAWLQGKTTYLPPRAPAIALMFLPRQKPCRELSGRGFPSASSFCSKLIIWVDTWLLLRETGDKTYITTPLLGIVVLVFNQHLGENAGRLEVQN